MAKLAINGGKPTISEGLKIKWPVFDDTDRKALTDVLESGRWCSLAGFDFDSKVAQFEKDNDFKLVRAFTEKPSIKDIAENPAVNAGIYLFSSDFVLSNMDKFLPDKPETSLERNLIERLVKEEKPILAAYLLDLCTWFDVGTLEQLIEVNAYIASGKRASR